MRRCDPGAGICGPHQLHTERNTETPNSRAPTPSHAAPAMSSLSHPLVLLGIASAVLGLGSAGVVWRSRDGRGARSYTVLLLLLSGWSLLYVGQLLAGSVGAKRPWLLARHAISPAVALTFWIFAARYTDTRWMLQRHVLAPAVVVGMVLSIGVLANPGDLYWRDLVLVDAGSPALLEQSFGPLFWAMIAYVAVVVGYGHARVVTMAMDSFDVYRRQLVAIGLSGVVGFGALAVFLSGHVEAVPTVTPNPHVQFITYATVLVAIPLGWSYYRDALFDLQPLANQTVIGNMDDGVVVVGTDGIVRKVNDRAEELLRGNEPLLGERVSTVFRDRPALRDRYEATRSSDGETDGGAGQGAAPVAIEVDGEQRYVDLRTSLIPGTAGDPLGTVLVLRDVTDRAVQRRRLERTNEQLERLADVVAHDLRAPLGTASKLTTLLAADLEDPDPAVEQSLADLEHVHDRLAAFADHIPKLAREAVDVESPVECDLRTLATDAWAVVDTDTVSLSVERTTTLEGDPRRLAQALENLFRNAVDHGLPATSGAGDGPAGTGPRISEPAATSETRPGDSTGNGCDPPEPSGVTTIRVGTFDGGVYVEDDGPGIPPRLREDVFEYGVSTAGGSGFGLAIVRTIVEAHGWSITATESADGGARFEIHTGP